MVFVCGVVVATARNKFNAAWWVAAQPHSKNGGVDTCEQTACPGASQPCDPSLHAWRVGWDVGAVVGGGVSRCSTVVLAISRRLPTPASQLVIAAVTATVAATVMRAGVSGAAPAIRAGGDRRKHAHAKDRPWGRPRISDAGGIRLGTSS